MYNTEEGLDRLLKFDYFKKLAKTKQIKYITDNLTGLINKNYMLEFAKSLVDEKIPFYFIIIDIDNFKQINDNYGHLNGDIVLKKLSSDLFDYVGDNGIVGRFGGDEFLVIDIFHLTYDSIHSFLASLYMECSVLRQSVKCSGCNPFVTGTIGCANHPKDAEDLTEIFNKADKALYRGKFKGRNCFIIYVHEKHKDIDTSKLIKAKSYAILNNLNKIVDKNISLDDKMKNLFKYVADTLKISNVVYMNKDYYIPLFNVTLNNEVDELLDENGTYTTNDADGLALKFPVLQEYVTTDKLASILISKIEYKKHRYGYVCFAETSTQRLWQDEEISLIIFLTKLLAYEFYIKENNK